LHLAYGQRDDIAPPDHGRHLHQVASTSSQLTIVPGASHLTLILMPETTYTLADWFATHLEVRETPHPFSRQPGAADSKMSASSTF
jgi:hypothetical protein